MKQRFYTPPKEKRELIKKPDEAGSTDHLHPAFNLQYIANRYCITDCDLSDQADFIIRIKKLCQLTWTQIKGTHRHSLGTESISIKSIKKDLPLSVPEDIDKFIVLRFSNNNKAMIGFRKASIYHVVWFDRDYSVYDHG